MVWERDIERERERERERVWEGRGVNRRHWQLNHLIKVSMCTVFAKEQHCPKTSYPPHCCSFSVLEKPWLCNLENVHTGIMDSGHECCQVRNVVLQSDCSTELFNWAQWPRKPTLGSAASLWHCHSWWNVFAHIDQMHAEYKKMKKIGSTVTRTSMQSPPGQSSKRKLRWSASEKLANCLRQKGEARMFRLMCCSAKRCLRLWARLCIRQRTTETLCTNWWYTF